MKTKFKVEIHKNGTHSEAILKMIGNSNDGIAKVDIDILCGYILARKALYPTLSDGGASIGQVGNTLHVYDKGEEQPYLSITECEMAELKQEFIELGELVSNDEDNQILHPLN